MRKISRSYSRWNPRNVHPIAQGCTENSYLRKRIKFDKHLFTPEFVSVFVYPCSHCTYQIRSPFLSPERQTHPLTLIYFNSAAKDRTNIQLSLSHSGQSTLELHNILVLSSLSFSLSASLFCPIIIIIIIIIITDVRRQTVTLT